MSHASVRTVGREAAIIAAAFAAYCGLVFLHFFPQSLDMFNGWLAWFEDPSNCYRIWWFNEVWSGRGESIWFMPNLLYPYGIHTVQASNGILKELFCAAIGGARAPWLCGNLISMTTPALVATAAFAVLRRRLRGAWLPAFVGAWLVGWTGTYVAHFVSPWIASTEGVVLYLGSLLVLRRRPTALMAVLSGLAAGLATWLQVQMAIYVFTFALVFAADCAVRRDWKGFLHAAGGGLIGVLISAPYFYQVYKAFGGHLAAVQGETANADIYIFRNTITSLFLPFPTTSIWYHPTENLLGRVSQLILQKAAAGQQMAGYLGWVPMILGVIGVKSRRAGTGFLLACFVTFVLLSFGPVISLTGDPTQPASLFGKTWIPGPYAFIKDLPPFNGTRTPARFALGAQISLGFLAAYGLLHLLRGRMFKRTRGFRGLTLALLLVVHYADLRWPLDFAPNQYSPWYAEVAKEPGEFAILDFPYERGMHNYMHLAAYHHKRTPWGFAARVPAEQFVALETAFRFPLIASGGEPDKWPTDYPRFAASLVKYDVHYIVMNKLHLKIKTPGYDFWSVGLKAAAIIDDPATWANQEAVLPPRRCYEDEKILVWKVEKKVR